VTFMRRCAGRRRGRAVALAAVAAAVLSAAPAWSAATAAPDYHVLGNDGAWEVGTGTDSQGNAYCSIQDQSADQSYGLLLLIYPLGDDPSFEVHAFKNSWSIPANADVPTKFQFSDGGIWDADGAAASDGSSVVDYTIDTNDMKDFLADFAQSNHLDIVFTKGTEPTWREDLTGSAQASADLLSCTNKLLGGPGGGNGGAPTQPFGQPGNSAPDNSQPYAPPDNGGSAPPGGNAQTL
jgi:hypothetical protein